jgi:hypothetical protein
MRMVFGTKASIRSTLLALQQDCKLHVAAGKHGELLLCSFKSPTSLQSAIQTAQYLLLLSTRGSIFPLAPPEPAHPSCCQQHYCKAAGLPTSSAGRDSSAAFAGSADKQSAAMISQYAWPSAY